jgi:hypothetical protein
VRFLEELNDESQEWVLRRELCEYVVRHLDESPSNVEKMRRLYEESIKQALQRSELQAQTP